MPLQRVPERDVLQKDVIRGYLSCANPSLFYTLGGRGFLRADLFGRTQRRSGSSVPRGALGLSTPSRGAANMPRKRHDRPPQRKKANLARGDSPLWPDCSRMVCLPSVAVSFRLWVAGGGERERETPTALKCPQWAMSAVPGDCGVWPRPKD